MNDIDDYIAGFPDDVRKILQKVRATIRKTAPDAEEAVAVCSRTRWASCIADGSASTEIASMPKTAMPMTFEEFRVASEAVENDRPIAVAVRQQRQWFRDGSFADQAMQGALRVLVGWIPWDGDAATGA
jgi:hypothetical protein